MVFGEEVENGGVIHRIYGGMRDGARWWLEWADDAAPAALKHLLTAGRSSLSRSRLFHWAGSCLDWAELHKGLSLLESFRVIAKVVVQDR